MQIQQAASMVRANPDLAASMRADPVATLSTMGAMPLQSDVWIYRAVIVTLGLTVVAIVGGAIVLAFHDKTMPGELYTIAAAAVAASAGLLKLSPSAN